MEINYYRNPNSQGYDQSWQSCQFTSDTDLSIFRSEPLVTINGQTYLRQHHITYLTGRETCRAHHFAKHLAIQLLQQEKQQQQHKPRQEHRQQPRVLWIDTLNGPHVSAAIFRELSTHCATRGDLQLLCLDVLGEQRDNHWWLTRSIEQMIKDLKPELVVIDDIDHFMPYCGIRVATEFNRVIRDAVNHTDTAFLFIGYNHTGKRACTTGDLGKCLFNSSTHTFSLSTVRGITTVSHIGGYDLHSLPGDAQFRFTIGQDNLPHETCMPSMAPHTGIDDDTLRDIVDAVIQPGITTDELLAQVRERHSQLKRSTRDAALLDQIRRLNLLDPHPAATTVDLVSTAASASNPVDDCAPAAQRHSQDQEINTELTLPPHQHNTNLAHEGDLKPLSGFAPWREARGVRMPQNNQIIPGHLQNRVS